VRAAQGRVVVRQRPPPQERSSHLAVGTDRPPLRRLGPAPAVARRDFQHTRSWDGLLALRPPPLAASLRRWFRRFRPRPADPASATSMPLLGRPAGGRPQPRRGSRDAEDRGADQLRSCRRRQAHEPGAPTHLGRSCTWQLAGDEVSSQPLPRGGSKDPALAALWSREVPFLRMLGETPRHLWARSGRPPRSWSTLLIGEASGLIPRFLTRVPEARPGERLIPSVEPATPGRRLPEVGLLPASTAQRGGIVNVVQVACRSPSPPPVPTPPAAARVRPSRRGGLLRPRR
jgi:hypothetical protein